MYYKKNQVTHFIVVILLTLGLLPFSSHAKAGEGTKIHPKIGSGLNKLINNRVGGSAKAESGAPSRITIGGSGERVEVFIYLKEGLKAEDVSFQGFDVQIIKSSANVIKASVLITELTPIADSIGAITFIKMPDVGRHAITDEGVSLTGASNYHLSGFTGQGVKIGVVDRGFLDLDVAIAGGEVPGSAVLIDCTGSTCQQVPSFPAETDKHGTGVTEVIYDMAPGAQLYLIKVRDSLDLADAKNFCVSNGIRVINHSLEWMNTNFYDGACWNSNPVCSAEDAFANNILWVNAAGNKAMEHYEATFTDTSPVDGWHDQVVTFPVTDPFDPFDSSIEIFFTWDAWPATTQDYDLFLFDPSMTQVASSETVQNGAQPPVEQIQYTALSAGTYTIRVKRVSATQSPRLEIYMAGHELDQSVATSSLVSPSDADSVIAVGAIYKGDPPTTNEWVTGPQEFYSGQGPTNDGRVKPDIMGPDGTTTLTFGQSFGTSIATPHVSGAAALVLSANPSLTSAQLRNFLTGSAIDMGLPGMDTIFGHGRLSLQFIPDLTPAPASINFGSVMVGDTSSQSVVTLSNTGTADLNITGIGLTNTTDFTVDTGGGPNPLGNPPAVIVPGDSRTVTVTFNPQSETTFSEGLTINSDDPDTPATNVSLSGTGTTGNTGGGGSSSGGCSLSNGNLTFNLAQLLWLLYLIGFAGIIQLVQRIRSIQ